MTLHLPPDQVPAAEGPPCEVCGEPTSGWHRDIVDNTNVLIDSHQVMILGQAYNEPCNCPIPGTEARPRRGRLIAGVDFSDLRETLDRTPSGEHTSADTDIVVSEINAAMEDWEREAARWSPDGSHEHDPPFWTRMDYGNGAMSGQADWGCDDVAERMRPGSTACFPWEGARR